MSAHTTTNGHLGFLESESRRRGYYQLVEGVNPELLVHDTVRVIDILDLDMKSGKFLATYPMSVHKRLIQAIDQKILVESIQKSILSVTSVPSPEVVTPPLRMMLVPALTMMLR
jgi:hypothetical protein